MNRLERGDEEAVVFVLTMALFLVGRKCKLPEVTWIAMVLGICYVMYRITRASREMPSAVPDAAPSPAQVDAPATADSPTVSVPVETSPTPETPAAEKPSLSQMELDFLDACAKGDADLVWEMLKTVDVNMKDRYGWTPLVFALFNGDFQTVQLLLDNGADPFIMTDDGWTAYGMVKSNALTDKKLGLVTYAEILKMIEEKYPQKKG